MGIIFIPVFSFFSKKKGYSVDLKERLVFQKPKIKNPVWFHCASVGELNVAKPLIKEVLKEKPVLITVFSPRGKSYAKKLFPEAEVRAIPFDISFLIKRFLKKYCPEVLILVEGEFWYNLITQTKSFSKIVSVNTRISPKSFKKYMKYSFFYRKIFDSIDLFLVRSEQDISFLKKLVKDKKKIVLCGDLKLVSSIPEKEVFLKTNGKPIIVAGSTHFPEESILFSVLKKIKKDYPDISLVIAPRHLERVKDISLTAEKFGFSYSFRSQTDSINTDIYIVDTLGELSGLYKYAKVVFVGGTFVPIGGHNILEPALLNKPVIIGKFFEKIKNMYSFLHKKGAVVAVSSEEELESWIRKALEGDFKPKIDLTKEQEKVLSCYTEKIKHLWRGNEPDKACKTVLYR
ncbi:MAG: 3-deoxy-D-manno-octulosonic acid transferase [Aquificae bacterium]|nr:3-deoxy-D-manno-octulosonic acid transferase [Aquificota bacterium]